MSGMPRIVVDDRMSIIAGQIIATETRKLASSKFGEAQINTNAFSVLALSLIIQRQSQGTVPVISIG